MPDASITLESPRGWWPEESGFPTVRGRDGTTISGPGLLGGAVYDFKYFQALPFGLFEFEDI